MAMEWKVAFPLHPEYRTLPMVWYIPPDRFVIPTAHREVSEDAYDVRGSCGFTFGNGCGGDDGAANLFGAKRARTVQTPVDKLKETV
jgi:nitrate reductase beta subunit